MIVDDEILFDAFTPINVMMGALARYRGANLGTLLLVAAGLELAENALLYYYRDLLPVQPREPSQNIAIGILATASGWWITDAAMRGAFQSAI
jgi:hypothetical protein